MMEKRDCATNGHTYSLWNVMEDKASRTCISCNHVQDYPLTSEILESVKKQYQAIPLMEGFLNVSFDDPNFLGYLDWILKKGIIDYVDENYKNSLITKLKAFVTTNFVSEENKLFIGGVIDSIENNNTDLFFDTMEQFREFNGEIEFVQNNHLKLG